MIKVYKSDCTRPETSNLKINNHGFRVHTNKHARAYTFRAQNLFSSQNEHIPGLQRPLLWLLCTACNLLTALQANTLRISKGIPTQILGSAGSVSYVQFLIITQFVHVVTLNKSSTTMALNCLRVATRIGQKKACFNVQHKTLFHRCSDGGRTGQFRYADCTTD